MANKITMDDLNEKWETLGRKPSTETLIVDIRTPEEFSEGHVPGATNLPVDQIDQHVNALKKYKEVYLYCRSGGRVTAAAQILEPMGLTNLQCVFSGGFPNWAARGFEIEFD